MKQRAKRLARTQDDRDTFASEDLVEYGAELAITVTDQEASTIEGRREGEVACLLGNPRSGRVRGAASVMNATALDLDEEQDVEPAQ
jgi:hypothetical protein